MWNIWILAAMVSLASYYTIRGESNQNPVPAMKSTDLAGNMAVYRAGVIAYLKNNPGITGPTSIADADLQPVLPSWFTPYPGWRNHVAADRTVTIYAASLPPAKITSELHTLAQGSLLAGEANTATNTVFSPGLGNTGIPLPANVAIPNGSPVWLAASN